MADVDRVWARIHQLAEARARENALLTALDARRIVARICLQECPEQPPDIAIEFLAREFVRLTLEGINPSGRYRFERGIA
ncbi:MAG: hypothetical protein JO190_01615 [Candidatus Eremiobacteraeota bacterium]|nr:hypothetical protein [Candidatus Eremiobacteraeota bacterium]MBV8499343.1 hypothetical protein [Candidatus Eremiobacteraeota bacterium]